MKRDMLERLAVLVVIVVSFACGVAATYFGMLWSGALA